MKKKILGFLSLLMMIFTLSSCAVDASIDYFVDTAHEGDTIVSTTITNTGDKEYTYGAYCKSPDERFDLFFTVSDTKVFKDSSSGQGNLVVRTDETKITGNTYVLATGFSTYSLNENAPKLSITNDITADTEKTLFYTYSTYVRSIKLKFKIEESTETIAHYQYRLCVNIAGVNYEFKLY